MGANKVGGLAIRPAARALDRARAQCSRAPQPLDTDDSGMSAAPLPDLQLVPQQGSERMRLGEISVFYDGVPAVRDASLTIHQGEVLALIGPSGCGKTTLLRTLNRLTELTPNARHSGTITLDGDDIHELEDTKLRTRVSMVFQQPNPFPMSIFDNVAFALREQSRRRPRRRELEPLVERGAPARRPVGGGPQRPRPPGAAPLRRPAAAAVHRARDRHRARDPADGRAVLGARSALDGGDRGADPVSCARSSRS